MKPPAPSSPPRRTLMGPGPSEPEPTVIAALSRPSLGHLDPAFLAVMDEIGSMLRAVFRTENTLTLPMSGTGSAGMETCFANLVEPGDRVLVGVHGVFGQRMAEVARRCGAEVTAVEAEWGTPLDVDALRAAAGGRPHDLVCAVHAETSTGVLIDVPPLRALADELGALLLLDTVTSLAGVPVSLDEWGVDATYSGTQKCLSCPPGLSPVSFSPRAQERLAGRSRPVQSWYLDLSLVSSYWGGERAYHHTAPVHMLYGLHEALRLVLEEGLEARWRRHALHARALHAGLEALGLELAVAEADRLLPLTSVRIPEGIDDAAARRYLLNELGLEIGGGLGPLKGRTWRIGVMGASASRSCITTCLAGIGAALAAQSRRAPGDALEAAREVYAAAD